MILKIYKRETMDNLNETINIRVSAFEKNRLRWLADKYADGNLSLYMVFSSLNIDRSNIRPEHLKDSRRNKARALKPHDPDSL